MPDPLAASLEACLLSVQAVRCTPKALKDCTCTAGVFAEHILRQAVSNVQGITPSQTRAYLVGMQRCGLKDIAGGAGFLEEGRGLAHEWRAQYTRKGERGEA